MMTPTAECLEVAHAFSDANLRAHPSTDVVMDLFSDSAIFKHGRFPEVGKGVARRVYKWLCEQNVLEFHGQPKVSFKGEDDHVVWSFESVQLRRKVLFSSCRSPQWYRINGAAKLYFGGSVDNPQICRYEMLKNEWKSLKDPTEAVSK